MSIYIFIFLSAVIGLILGMIFALLIFKPKADNAKFVKAEYRRAAPEADAMPIGDVQEKAPEPQVNAPKEKKTEAESRLQREARARRGVSMVDLTSQEDVREHLKAGKAKEERGYNILKKS